MNKAIDIDTGTEYSFSNAEDLRLSLQEDWGVSIDTIDPGVEGATLPVYVYLCPYAMEIHSQNSVRYSLSYADAVQDRREVARDI